MSRVISDRVRALSLESGELRAYVDITDRTGRYRLLSSEGPVGRMPRLDVVSGSITTDDTRDIPGSGTITLIAQEATLADVVPLQSRHPLSPLAKARVQIYYGHPDDPRAERTPYGLYDISDLDLEETSEGVTIRAEFFDLARRIQRARFPGPWLVVKGTSYEQGLINLLIGVVDEDDINYTPTGRKSAAHWVYEPQDDRLVEIKRIGTASSFRLDFNEEGRGRLGFHPEFRETDDPVWTFEDGGNCKIVGPGAKRRLSDEKAYNGVVAMGDATASDKAPVRAEVWDTNPLSLTYYDPANPDASSYGPVPFFYVSKLITTTKQARDAARARLPKVAGMTERLTFTAVPNPGVETGDPARVVRPKIGASGVYIIESVEMPLRGSDGRMMVTCRERRVFE